MSAFAPLSASDFCDSYEGALAGVVGEIDVDLTPGGSGAYEVLAWNEDEDEIVESCLRILEGEAGFFTRKGSGRRVYCQMLLIAEERRRRGIGQAIYGAEEELFGRWGAVEAYMDASNDNKRLAFSRFGFKPAFPEELEFKYRRWCKKEGKKPAAGIEDYPDEFLEGLTSIPAVKVLGLAKDRSA